MAEFIIRAIALPLCILLYAESAKAKGPMVPITLQPYIGSSVIGGGDKLTYCLQVGMRYTSPRLPYYLGLENHCYYSKRKYTWPDIGDYRFMKNYNNFGIAFGMHINKTYKLNLDFGLRAYFFNINGKLKTNNDELKENIKDYHYFNGNIGLNIHLNYRITHRYSTFININMITLVKEENYPIIGVGVAYNMYNKYDL